MASAKDAGATPFPATTSKPTPADDKKLKSAALEAKADDKPDSKEEVALAKDAGATPFPATTSKPTPVDDTKLKSAAYS